MKTIAAVLALCLGLSPALAGDSVPLLPSLAKTPGAANPTLDEAKVCSGAFTTRAYRRGSKSDRRCVLARYGKPPYAFTYDHLVPLELGGLDACENLWPEPRAEARMKDKLEDSIRSHVCVCHDLTLPQGQELFRQNWRKAYAIYVTPKGMPMCEVNKVR